MQLYGGDTSMELSKEKLSILTSQGLVVNVWNDSRWHVMKPNEVRGNFVDGYKKNIFGENLEVITVLNSPISDIYMNKGRYYFSVWDIVPGPGPGDFSNEFDSLDDCLQDILDYYFGDSRRMDEKKGIVELERQTEKKIQNYVTAEFWKLIALIDIDALDRGDEEKAVEALVSALSKGYETEINRFQETLSKYLYQLDGKAWWGESELGVSDDSFLYARCYIVAKGHDYYMQVLQDPKLMPKGYDCRIMLLLYVAEGAWANVTGANETDYEFEPSVSYETGSNSSQW